MSEAMALFRAPGGAGAHRDAAIKGGIPRAETARHPPKARKASHEESGIAQARARMERPDDAKVATDNENGSLCRKRLR